MTLGRGYGVIFVFPWGITCKGKVSGALHVEVSKQVGRATCKGKVSEE